MRLDDMLRRSADQVNASLAEHPVPAAPRPSSRRRSTAALGAAAAVTVVLVGVLVAMWGTRSQRLDPSSGVMVSSTTAAVSPTEPSVGDTALPVVAASSGPEPSIETKPPLSLRPEDRDDVVVHADSDLSPELENVVRKAAVEAASAGVGSPLGVEVVATMGGETFGILTVADGSQLPLVVGASGAEVWLTSGAGNIAVHYGERNLGLPIVEIVWMGLPPEASYVAADFIGIDFMNVSNRPVPVSASSAFMAIPKPEWHQYVTLTAHAADGAPVAETEVLVDGSKCSAGRLALVTGLQDHLLEPFDLTRNTLVALTYGCRFIEIGAAAVGDGPYFGVSADALAGELRERDRRDALMSRLYAALITDPTMRRVDGATIYSFSAEGVEIAIDSDGRWIGAIG